MASIMTQMATTIKAASANCSKEIIKTVPISEFTIFDHLIIQAIQ